MIVDSNATTLCIEEMDVLGRYRQPDDVASLADVTRWQASLQVVATEHKGNQRVGAEQFDDAGARLYLRDCGPSHILVFAPTRSGKGVGIVIPTLLTWPHSALIHDLKGENWAVTSGARQRMGQICLKYAPASPDEDGARFNPLAEVRLRTPHEIRDVRNIAQMIMDPNGKGLPDHWLRAAVEGFTGFTLAQLYENRDLNLTTDFRDVLGELVARHLGNLKLPDVFPDYEPRFLGLVA